MSTGPTPHVPAEDRAPAGATAAGATTAVAPAGHRRRRVAGVLAGGLALTLVAGSTAAALPREPLVAAVHAAPGAGGVPAWPDASSGSGSGSGSGFGAGGGTGTAATTQTDATPATADEATGVVVVETVLGYQDAEAAGTGIVLTSDGLVLTNNHVVAGATEIQVEVPGTGATYPATVVGTDASSDVAVLELDDGSGLATATLDDDGEPAVGDAVTAVGNAGGTGELVAADGTVTALEQTITTAAEGSAAGETLDGLIEVDADIVSGDSGGPLLDAEGEVVGVDTAASSGTADIVGYAIDIDDAMAIVEQVLSGEETATVSLGYPAFLGVEVASEQTASAAYPSRAGYGYGAGTWSGGDAGLGTSSTAATATAGALVAGVVAGTPAATAGLAAGDTITAVDGAAVGTADDLTADLAEHDPGDTVTVTWTDAAGQGHEADVTLAQGPVA
ncbi:S1C family serine protease [Puerhibacterium sp. TATVAM-FAB25]|uniref:S1C family serine protease n=1 Tax=Puerhibacterium sp. TATVAM-FAB25 TaxID=3093699 RepID=UPI00397CA6C6